VAQKVSPHFSSTHFLMFVYASGVGGRARLRSVG
jgi:hypothetical protein